MLPIASPPIAAQWLLLIGYAVLFVLSAVVTWRMPRLRPAAAVSGSLAVSHVAFYALFLLFPDVLDARQTMWLSIVIRFQVLFTVALLLALAVLRRRWRV
jgi:hypothetical protein